jgi:hypothetical protein
MLSRHAWLTTALVVVGLGAAGLYANHQAGSNVPTTGPDLTKAPVASVPAGGQPGVAAAVADEPIAAADKHQPDKPDKPVGKGPQPGADPAGESAASKPAEPAAPPDEAKVVPSPLPAEDHGGAAGQSSDSVPTGDVPAHSPPVRHQDRYGNREPYEGTPPAEAPPTGNLDRYGDREPYEGVPRGQAPDVRGANGGG